MKLGRLNHIGVATPSIEDGIVTLNSFQGPCLNCGQGLYAVRHKEIVRHGC